MMWKYILYFIFIYIYNLLSIYGSKHLLLHDNGFRAKNVTSMRFLITVNDTWDPNGCIATVLTEPLKPNRHNIESINVGGCDHGPLDFSVRDGSDSGTSKMTVNVVFYSSVIMDASHPACDIEWNGTYLIPKEFKFDNAQESLLPGCFVMDSREGYHMTYYWFHLLDWSFSV